VRSVRVSRDEGMVVAAVAQNGLVLPEASAELQGDRVLSAVANNGRALHLASGEMKGDREVVRVAVAQEGVRSFSRQQT